MRLLSILLVASILPAQSRSEFEVASIKPVDLNTPHMVGIKVQPGGNLTASALNLKALIVAAFRVSYWQVSGGEPWMQNDLYDITAKPSQKIANLRYTNSDIDDPQLRQMLQALLIDRFQLKFHRQTKTGDIYLLERSNKPRALRPSERETPFGSIGYVAAKWSIFATTMPQLAKFASDNVFHVPVLDRTGLTGAYDYRQSNPDLEPNYNDPSDSFRRFIPELGLKLTRSKGPVEIFVIDQASKPSPN